ncbi:hypothetical protein [uncultured Lutibacter sp.]|uniref:hypothetical protein n=1 Tax=uncultured Lutibacter sp. TaxID=437739 RepID=UPI002636DE9E|nr:hypothetical protein [uncultured Lutibacter sp.]
MIKIIDFLQSQSQNENISENLVDKDKLSKSFNDIKNVLVSSEVKEKNIFQLKNRPKTKKGQIWLCKQQYYDAFGNEIIGNAPYLVYVASNIEKFANENFIRIQPISPFTEFLAIDEILIKDNSVVGFDFIIETWNEQPILNELLDEFVGNINIETLKIDETELNLSKYQKEFRKAEIRNTAYLRQSINALIEFEESNDEKTIFLNINNSIVLPKRHNGDDNERSLVAEPITHYLQAAKKGKIKDRPTYFFEKIIEGINVEIKVIKDGESYILSVKQPGNIEIKDITGKILKQATKDLYDNLEGGLYFIRINGIEKEIRIRLK